jgi:hypothetical protein
MELRGPSLSHDILEKTFVSHCRIAIYPAVLGMTGKIGRTA